MRLPVGAPAADPRSSLRDGAGDGMKRVLVTGATGQDGGYLLERLEPTTAEVHVLARGGGRSFAPSVTVHDVDLRDGEALAAVVDRVAPDTVFNLAAISSVAASWEDPVAVGEVNGLAVARLLHALAGTTARTGGRPVFVQASSQEVFGAPTGSPQTERTPVAPINPYGAAKAYAQQMVATYRARGVVGTSLVLYSHESPRRPPAFAARRITQGVARIAHGLDDTLELGNLDAVRDWGWAPDVVDAMVRAAEAAIPEDFVIATGESHSVREFVAAAFAVAGIDDWEARVRIDPGRVRPADAPDLRGDATKATERLGWRPTMRFAAIVEAMVRHDLAEIEQEREGSRR